MSIQNSDTDFFTEFANCLRLTDYQQMDTAPILTAAAIARGGTVVMRVPQDRSGWFGAPVFEQCQRIEKALVATLPGMTRNPQGGTTQGGTSA